MVHTQDLKIAPDMDLDVVARGTPGFSGADLANLVNEAAINAVRANRDIISADDFDRARDRLLLGRRDAMNALLPDEKHGVAVRSGRAVVARFRSRDPVAGDDPPCRRGARCDPTLPEDERISPESYLQDSLAVRLGGRAAEVLSSARRRPAQQATWPARPTSRPRWSVTGDSRPDWSIGFADATPSSFGPDGFARPVRGGDATSDRREVARLLRGRGRHRVAAHASRAVRLSSPPSSSGRSTDPTSRADGPRPSGRS